MHALTSLVDSPDELGASSRMLYRVGKSHDKHAVNICLALHYYVDDALDKHRHLAGRRRPDTRPLFVVSL